MKGNRDTQSEIDSEKHKKARKKLALLELAEDLHNVSKACRMLGYSRQHYYEIKRNYKALGFNGLIDQQPGAKHPHPNRVDSQTEKRILDHALQFPLHGPNTVALSLNDCDHIVSSGGVRGVFSRHNLLHKDERLKRLKQAVIDRSINPTDGQLAVLEEHSPEFRERHINANQSGDFVAIDCFPVSNSINNVRVYVFTAVDCFSRFAVAELYPSRSNETFTLFFRDCVVPTFQEHNVRIRAVIDNNTQAVINKNSPSSFDRFLRLEDIEFNPLLLKHRHGNGFSDTFRQVFTNEPSQNDFMRLTTSLEEARRALANWLIIYNQERVISRGAYRGRTPYNVFKIIFGSSKQ